MNTTKQRIAIGKLCGWTQVETYKWDNSNPSVRLPKQFHIDKSGVFHNLPDYLSDLNAMHEAERILTPEQWDNYCEYLFDLLGIETPYDNPNLHYSSFSWLIHATAAQHAEAFLKTFDLWAD